MLKRLYIRYQDLLGWLPLQVVLAIAAIVGFGALARGLGPDLLSWLAELPIRAGYAVAALGVAYLAWRRWRMQLTDDEQRELWRRLLAGELGALVVHGINAAFYLATLALALWFFRPAS